MQQMAKSSGSNLSGSFGEGESSGGRYLSSSYTRMMLLGGGKGDNSTERLSSAARRAASSHHLPIHIEGHGTNDSSEQVLRLTDTTASRSATLTLQQQYYANLVAEKSKMSDLFSGNKPFTKEQLTEMMNTHDGLMNHFFARVKPDPNAPTNAETGGNTQHPSSGLSVTIGSTIAIDGIAAGENNKANTTPSNQQQLAISAEGSSLKQQPKGILKTPSSANLIQDAVLTLPPPPSPRRSTPPVQQQHKSSKEVPIPTTTSSISSTSAKVDSNKSGYSTATSTMMSSPSNKGGGQQNPRIGLPLPTGPNDPRFNRFAVGGVIGAPRMMPMRESSVSEKSHQSQQSEKSSTRSEDPLDKQGTAAFSSLQQSQSEKSLPPLPLFTTTATAAEANNNSTDASLDNSPMKVATSAVPPPPPPPAVHPLAKKSKFSSKNFVARNQIIRGSIAGTTNPRQGGGGLGGGGGTGRNLSVNNPNEPNSNYSDKQPETVDFVIEHGKLVPIPVVDNLKKKKEELLEYMKHYAAQYAINPFREKEGEKYLNLVTHNRRRWSHVFPDRKKIFPNNFFDTRFNSCSSFCIFFFRRNGKASGLQSQLEESHSTGDSSPHHRLSADCERS
jgi:hypothetical protein